MRGLMRTGAGLVFAMVLSLQPQALAETYLQNAYFDSALSFNACMQKGQSVLQAYGATNIVVFKTAIGGLHGDYGFNVVCLTAKGVVLVIVGGPDAPTGVSHANSLVQRMQAR